MATEKNALITCYKPMLHNIMLDALEFSVSILIVQEKTYAKPNNLFWKLVGICMGARRKFSRGQNIFINVLM